MSTQFETGDRVRFVGHPEHSPPEVLRGMDGQVEGKVLEGPFGGELYRVGVDGLRTPFVQLHAEQLEAIDG